MFESVGTLDIQALKKDWNPTFKYRSKIGLALLLGVLHEIRQSLTASLSVYTTTAQFVINCFQPITAHKIAKSSNSKMIDCLTLRLVYVVDQIVFQVRRKEVCHLPRRIYQLCTNASFDTWRIRFKTCICKNQEHLRNWLVNSSRSLRLQTWKVHLQSTDGFNAFFDEYACSVTIDNAFFANLPKSWPDANWSLPLSLSASARGSRPPSITEDITEEISNFRFAVLSIRIFPSPIEDTSVETPRALTNSLKGGALSPDSANLQPSDFKRNLIEASTDTCSLLSAKVTKSSN